MTMANLEKRHLIDSKNLSGESYFTSILHEAYAYGLLNDSEIENIQLQCIKFLAYKSERYNDGESSSIRVEAAESIMKSNLYTIGLYLKSLPDADCAVSELKIGKIPEMYQKGRVLINGKVHSAKHFYIMAKANKITTLNYTYNATLDEGIGIFFKAYNPDYAAHEVMASIDYQLCNPVTDLTGVEFVLKYLENLFIENEFCSYFDAEDIHHLLSGYDEGYKDLLINIFEQLVTATLRCTLANRSVLKLDSLKEEIERLQDELAEDDDYLIALKIHKATEKVLRELRITTLSLRRYIENSLPRITSSIVNAVRTNTLGKTFVSPTNPDLKPKIQFLSSAKMDDKDYREFINELLICRYSSDKLALIKEKVKSFGDIEDLLFDARLSEEEITSVLDIFRDVEIAELIRRHPFKSSIQAVDLSETEQTLRLYVKSYIDQLTTERQERIFGLVNHLMVDER
ncbi:DUF6179 domain-containing protein [Desulfosporosinus nitroreducens]|uniref:DUF6179 domain-containing protein n=1 Tax=Desulfosporosinus nitroreducens TaxID=2018668 RepID=A0ABT8QPB9_9FIRM|nr:DUF6179 domain-containing protein [Desulfosporosinus nitroreducens]MDO0823191.1 DUF6179 domain-containing protein [Desulfosporosinus nitroreducens]